MTTPIPLPDGSTITSWDSNVIEVVGASGQAMRVARAAAPAAIRQAVDLADAGGMRALGYAGIPTAPSPMPQAAPSAPAAAPAMSLREQGFAGVAPDAPAASAAAPGPAAASPAAATAPPAVALPGNPLQPVNDRIAELRGLPQTVSGGGGTRVVTQTSGPPESAVEQARGFETDAAVATESIAGELEREGELRSDEAEAFEQQLGSQVRFEEQSIADQVADDAAFNERVAGETTKLSKLQEASKTQIDPRKIWKDRGTGNRILAALSAAAGAFASGLTGQPNSALALIDKAIERDIDAQLENRQGKRQEAADQAGFMKVLEGQYGSRAEQRRAGIIMGREHSATIAERLAAMTNVEAVKSQYLQKAEALRAQNARDTQAFILQTAGNVTTTRTPTAGGARPSAAAQAADRLSAMTYMKFDPESSVPAAERYAGVPMQAIGGAEDARDINKQMASVEGLDIKLAKLEQLGKNGFASLNDKKIANSLFASAMLDAKNIDQAGALDIGAERIMREMLGPNPADWVKVSGTVIPSVRSNYRARVAATLRNRAAAVDPTTVPLSMRARFAPGATGGGGAARPATQPLPGGG